ncbi:alpha/beta hydrolase [Synechococcus sp. PROS-9-1]|uniref:alpha/beta hydrolase n=1 Tax=Synechococcus sp. PROS-9-1 TaxID=1968775 RepID=UPI00351C218C
MRRRSTGLRIAAGCVCSLLFLGVSPRPLWAASQLEVQIDGTVIPFSIGDLALWARSDGRHRSELSTWFSLLAPDSRAGVLELLQAPVVLDRSMARQLMNSWAGRQLFDQFADLVRVDNDKEGVIVRQTINDLLSRQQQVSSLDLLEALPADSVRLDLDLLLELASSWRMQLERQQNLVRSLDRFPVTASAADRAAVSPQDSGSLLEPHLISLAVSHREEPLGFQLWLPGEGSPKREQWMVLMPGLGGSPDHFRWLGRGLSRRGWAVLVLEHPGSDDVAVQALLEGRLPPPGVEVLPARLKDLDALLKARDQEVFQVPGQRLVLAGHSLGAFSALLSTGARPAPGLARRCSSVLGDLPLSNLSRLLQCQLVDVSLPKQVAPKGLSAVIGFNSFGSLLWPAGSLSKTVKVPVLFTGGTLDLITPPLSEQLGLLLAMPADPSSRVVLVEGASHFSPVRVEGQRQGGRGEDLFQLGEELVGVQPLQVQALLEQEVVQFLVEQEQSKAEHQTPAKTLHLKLGELHLHRLDRDAAQALVAQ